MKRFIVAIAAMIMSVANISAQRLSDITVEAQYITDKMMVELGLSNFQRNRILQINLNYLSGITSYRDINSRIWKQRNRSLKAMLNSAQWRMYQNAGYFYRPIGWKDGAYVHNIYSRYPQRHYDCKMPPPPHMKGHKGDKRKWNRDRHGDRRHDAPKHGRGGHGHFGSRR